VQPPQATQLAHGNVRSAEVPRAREPAILGLPWSVAHLPLLVLDLLHGAVALFCTPNQFAFDPLFEWCVNALESQECFDSVV
jgi:hypothetical protein